MTSSPTTEQALAALEPLRAQGWSVAVHNDYRLNGEPHTFWLFTHPSGRWIKGEGRTDDEAIREAHAALTASPAAPSDEETDRPLNLNITREWFERKATLEDGCEIGAGARRTMTLNLTDEDMAALQALAEKPKGEPTVFHDPPTGPHLTTQAEQIARLLGEVEEAQQEAADKDASADSWHHQHRLSEDRAAGLEAEIARLTARLGEVEPNLAKIEPFLRLAKAVTEPDPDREWLNEAKDWMVVFSFVGESVTLGDLRALAAFNTVARDEADSDLLEALKIARSILNPDTSPNACAIADAAIEAAEAKLAALTAMGEEVDAEFNPRQQAIIDEMSPQMAAAWGLSQTPPAPDLDALKDAPR